MSCGCGNCPPGPQGAPGPEGPRGLRGPAGPGACVSNDADNTLVVGSDGCMYVPPPEPPEPFNGFAALAGAVDLQPTGNNAWTDTPLEVTLPVAGTYHIDATVRGYVTGPSLINTAISARLMDVNAGAVVPNSEILVVQHLRAQGSTPTDGDNDTAPIQVEYIVGGPSVIRLQAMRANIGGASTSAGVHSAPSGRTTLRFLKVA